MSERAQSTALPPSSATSHGKIRTENSELLNLLREKTSDSSGPINHTPSRQSLNHAADYNLTPPQASAGRRLVDVDNNLQVSTAPSQLESPAQSNVDPALTNTETARDTEDNLETESNSHIIVPPLNLETNRNSEAYYSSSANPTAKDNGQLTTESDLVKSGVERNKYLHEILVNPSQNPPQVDVSSDPNLHVSRKNSVSSVKSHLSNTSAPVLSSRSVALHGDGNNTSALSDHKTDDTVQNKADFGNSENKTASFQDLQTARSDNFDVDETQRSLVLDSALHVLPTPKQSAPVTGRQTYDVPSPISTQIPNIDSLSNFSNPDDREEKPVPRTRSSKQGSTLTSRSIPVPGQGATSPRHSATTRLASSRDPSATARSSSGVYAVANPAVLIAQGITPAPNQQSVQFTPRPQPRTKQASFVDSLEAPSKATGEGVKRDETKDGKKSAVSFREGRDQINSQPTNDPYTGAESPVPGSEPDWDSPRLQDRLPTPHPTSDNYRFSPTQPVWEKEEQEEQKSSETLEPRKSPTEVPNGGINRSDSPETATSPTPLDENDRKVDSALPIPGGSASSEARVVRTDSLPTVQKVYVDSPTFTREEEDEYRFVESRLGEIQDDVEETLRKLDEETEKQRKIRKQLEDQMATMYAPAYEDQGNGQPYGQNTQYGEPPRENMGSDSNIRNQEDRSYQEPRRENMGSYSTLRNEERNSYGAPRRESMGSYSNGRNDDRNTYTEQRKENMGSYASVRNDDRQSYGDPRRENMGSYASLRNDERQSYGDPRRENMGSYTSLRNDERQSYGDPRRENMGSYTSVRNDDRNSYGEPRRETNGSYPSVKNEDRNSYGERNSNGAYQPARNEDRQSYDEPRRDNMGSYTSVQPNDRRSNGVPNRENMGSYSNVQQENGYNQGTYNPPPRQPESYGQNENVENQGYGGRGQRDNDRYEDRDFDDQGNRNRFENQDQQPESERYNPPSHIQNMNYEPHDEDLRREAEYQEGLKMRISESGKKDMEIQIPRLPLESEQFRDSLEEDNFRDWDNPPPNPFANEGGVPHQQERHEHFEESKVPAFVDENDTARMEFLHPKSPRYDFIEMNKIDYGKPHEKSYREIKHVREEESKKLEKVFIHPRLSSKKKSVKPGLKSAPSKFQVSSPIEEMDPEDPAQALWAKRSAQLKKKDSKSSSGHSNKHKGLQRNQSDSRLTRPAGQGGTFTYNNHNQVVYGSPTRSHFLEPMENRPPPPHIPRPEPQYTTNSEPINFPDRHSDHQSPPLRSRPLDLKPITQEIMTEDGQRISVDINLKVLSPPPGSGTGAPHTLQAEVQSKDVNRRPTGMQYQMEDNYHSPEHEPQQHHNYNQILSPPPEGGTSVPLSIPLEVHSSRDPNSQRHQLGDNYHTHRLEHHQQNNHSQYVTPPPENGTKPPQVVHMDVHTKDLNRRRHQMRSYQSQKRVHHQQNNHSQVRTDYHQQNNHSQYYDAYPRYNQYYPDDTRYDQENVVPGGGEHVPHTDDTYRMSPYSKVPPIHLTEEELDRQLAEMEQNGYSAMYKQHKNKPQGEKPWYQVYTINDYRKMQNEVRLTRAPLGPDLDNETYKEKLEKRHKQFEYARMVMEKNRQQLDVRKPPVHPKREDEKPNKRKTAIDYSKNIPKPNVKPRPNQYNSYEVAAQLSPAAKRSGPSSPTQTVDVIDLQKLKNRHDQEKQNVASIRQNMETVPQKA